MRRLQDSKLNCGSMTLVVLLQICEGNTGRSAPSVSASRKGATKLPVPALPKPAAIHSSTTSIFRGVPTSSTNTAVSMKYEGKSVDGKPQGRGKATYLDGTVYM